MDELKEINKRKVKNTYESTELMLYKLNVLPDIVKELKTELKNLNAENNKMSGIKIKSSKLILKEKDNTYIYADETLLSRINVVKQTILKTQSYIRYANKILKKFENDEYYPIIDMIYFKKKTYDDISNEYGWAIGTISKHKSRLINEMKVYFYPCECLEEH